MKKRYVLFTFYSDVYCKPELIFNATILLDYEKKWIPNYFELIWYTGT